MRGSYKDYYEAEPPAGSAPPATQQEADTSH